MTEIKIINKSEKFDFSSKIIIVGDCKVGKSQLLSKVITNNFSDIYTPTIGFDFQSIFAQIDKTTIQLKIMDTTGEEVYQSLISNFIQELSLVILVYSIDNEDTFKHLNNWVKEIRKKNSDIKIILVGNKSDLEENRKISKEDGLKFQYDNKIEVFFESSAKDGNNAKNIFLEALKIIYDERQKFNPGESGNKGKNIENNKKTEGDSEKVEEKDKKIFENEEEKGNQKINDEIKYCEDCKIFCYNTCEKFHFKLCEKHHLYSLNENFNSFTGICREKNHFKDLDYFCKTHGKLCCEACIGKIKDIENDKHKNCDFCFIKDIETEIDCKLEENKKCLKDLLNKFGESINENKKLLERMNEIKEYLKLKVNLIFANIKYIITVKKDFILSELDNKFNYNEEIINKKERLYNIIKLSLENGKILDGHLNYKEKLYYLNNYCNNIETDIEEMKLLKEKCEKNLNLSLKDKKINNFIEKIEEFGDIISDNY